MIRSNTRLQPGDPVPHFRVGTIDGRRIEYSTIWQRRNLVLVALTECDSAPSRTYVSQLKAELSTFQSHETECVITRDVVAGAASPAVLIADRWGEIVYVAHVSNVVDLPRLPEILDWVAYLQTRCPECEGETK
jgi:peroxiredoxin